MISDAALALSFLIREARADDLESLYRLDQLCFEPGIAYTRRQMRLFLTRPGARSAVAEVGGQITGFAVGALERGDVWGRGSARSARSLARIVTLDVHPDHRRQGLGKALLAHLLARLREEGARESRLEVDVHNPGAIAFYEGLGFRTRGRLEDYYAPGRAALEMGRTEPGE